MTDFNPRSPRGERPTVINNLVAGTLISIHALREESDSQYDALLRDTQAFQSTLSARRATISELFSYRWYCHFNPRSPRGERRLKEPVQTMQMYISIHALREESDEKVFSNDYNPNHVRFQSTLSARRATLGYTLSTKAVLHIFQSTLSARRATRRFKI